MSALISKSGVKQNLPDESEKYNPTWFQNYKKRTIPSHLVPKKKIGFHIASSSATKKDKNSLELEKSSNQFDLPSFGSLQRKPSSQGNDWANETTINDLSRLDESIDESVIENSSLFPSNDDAPPPRTLYDLVDEAHRSLNEPTNVADSFLSKEPKHYPNVFSGDRGGETSTERATGAKTSSNLKALESAILVFGYPEYLATEVIRFFMEFGEILEDFQVNEQAVSSLEVNTREYKPIPVLSGINWVKLTYSNPSSAMTALQENGSIFNGVILGVIPYHKDAVGKLQKKKINPKADIGGSQGLGFKFRSKSDSKDIDLNVSGASTYQNNLEVKDGSGLFLKTKSETKDAQDPKGKTNEKKLPLWQRFSDYIFGFNEL